jgi:HlyD family secretion protein
MISHAAAITSSVAAMARRKPKIAGAAAVAIVALGWWMAAPGPSPTAAADPASLLATVDALGRVEPQGHIISLSAPGPNTLATLLVHRGDPIHKGQVLGTLATYDEAVAQRDEIRARIDEATKQLAAETAFGTANIQDAELQLKQVSDLDPLRVAAQQATVTSLEARLSNDKDILHSQKTLRVRGFATRRAFDNQQALVRQQNAELQAARARLNELKRRASLDVAQATAALAQAKAAAARAEAKIPLQSLRRQLAVDEADVRLATLISPIDGKVLNVLVRPGGVVDNQPVLTLGDTSRMWVVAEVYDTEVHLVHLGQTARITTAASPAPLTGKVIEVGQMVYKNDVLHVDPAARADARVVQVRIALDDGRPVQSLTNLTVDVAIDIHSGQGGNGRKVAEKDR